MTQIEIKEKLISKINQLDDDFILSEIYNILENDNNGIYILNDFQKKDINFAMNQIEDGKFITNEDTNLEVRQWLQK